MSHDIYLFILDHERVVDIQIAREFPGREHDALHLVRLGLVRLSFDATGTTFRIRRLWERSMAA